MSSRIDFLKNHQLAKNLLLINRGIEKESLRTDKFGYLSQKKHPKNRLGGDFFGLKMFM